MVDKNFVVKNGLVVNGQFTANSVSINHSTFLSGNSLSFNVGSPLYANSSAGITANNLLLQGDGTNATIKPTNSGSVLSIGSSNTTQITVAANGNVGIANAVPIDKLSVGGSAYVNGNLTLGSSTIPAGLQANGSYGTAGQILTSNGTATFWGAGGVSGANTQIQFNDSGFANGYVGLTFNKTSNTLYVGNNINTVGSANVGGSANIAGTLTVATNTVTFGTTSYFVSNGNVGIQTNAPGYTLTVNGYIFGANNIYANNLLIQGDGTNATIKPTNSGSALSIGSNNINQILIAANGNIGVGNTTPIHAIAISTTTGGIAVSNTASTGVFGPSSLGGIGLGTTTTSPLIFYTNNINRMQINAAGDTAVGAGGNAVNALRYFDIYNQDTGASTGVDLRLITKNVAGSGTTSADIIKTKLGVLYIKNNEYDASATTQFTVGTNFVLSLDTNGNVVAPDVINGSMRARIFYDQNDTTYYVDPNGLSNMVAIRWWNSNFYTSTSSGYYVWGGAQPNPSGQAMGTTYAGPPGDCMYTFSAVNGAMSLQIDGSLFVGGGTNQLSWGSGTVGGIWADGQIASAASMRSPIYYDHNDTGYYVDPNYISKFNSIVTSGNIYSNNLILQGDGTNAYIRTINSSSNLILGANNTNYVYLVASGNFGIGTDTPDHPLTVAGGSAIAYFNSSATQSFIRLSVNSDIGQRIELANRGGRTALWNPISGDALNISHSSGQIYTVFSMSSPIYYDRDNTAYYVDPNSLSNMVGIRWWNSNFFTSTSSGYYVWGGSQPNPSGQAMGTSYAGPGDCMYTFSSPDGAMSVQTDGSLFVGGGTNQLSWGSGTVGVIWADSQIASAHSMRAPIYYDHNDTGYFVDPNYISRINAINPNIVYLPSNNGYRLWGGATDPSCRLGDIYVDYMLSYGPSLSTIHYDQNDTGYYVDPNWVSNMRRAITRPVSAATNTSGGTAAVEIQNLGGTGDGDLAQLGFVCPGYFGVNLNLRADGYFGLGGWSTGPWIWFVSPGGDMQAAGNVTAYSDPRLKENFERVINPLDILRVLDGGTFNWKHGFKHTEIKAGKRDYGILADQVNAVMPEIVTDSIEIDGEKFKTVAYDKLVPVLIEAIKQLEARIVELEAK